jgi:hypothetical protein
MQPGETRRRRSQAQQFTQDLGQSASLEMAQFLAEP